MSKIRVMSENLANQIAAGEVVERVVSIVKELVENAIDAGSTEISVYLKESGLREIVITDNGIGMDRDDAVIAFKRHATSKLYSVDDLFSITSLGFRGEALPSIASISEVELRTCYKGEEVGTYLHLKGGELLLLDSIASRVGTSIKITNMFYNTPARLKHLSSSYAELSQVIEYLNKMALSRPDIRFKLVNDEKELIVTLGSGNMLKVINSIYGIEITKKMIFVKGENNDYSVSGYISLPEVTRSNKNHMTTLVNGRVIKNTYLYRTINEAYSNYKEDSRYPLCVLKIECDPSLLDVNIHPSKLDIKFSNFDDLNSLIKEVIIKGLNDKLLIPNIKPVTLEGPKYTEMTLNIDRANVIQEEEGDYKKRLEDLVNYQDNNEEIEELGEEELANISEVKEMPLEKLPELYPVALLLGTYIVCENEKGIYLIDQHAAKERVNYEKVSEMLAHPNNLIIKPLVPIVLELPQNEFLIIKENIDILNDLNISVEEFGLSSFRVISHPVWFPNGMEEETFKRIIEMILAKGKDFSLAKFRDNLAKMVSCKMSIKANTYIDKSSMESLINDLRKCKNPFNCPHGRPAIIHFSIYDIEKMFKRSM
ncbi:MAG: DNA mismatch repair endonuclease MutL [bacterium]|nr:DNA mismatch repair endonuclease MutL [bacterium]